MPELAWLFTSACNVLLPTAATWASQGVQAVIQQVQQPVMASMFLERSHCMISAVNKELVLTW